MLKWNKQEILIKEYMRKMENFKVNYILECDSRC